jgi:TonB family protein
MNAFINYMLEANLGLCLFLLLYFALLKNETDFSFKRLIVLGAIVISLVFPLFHISMQNQVVPAIGSYIPRSWLPEMVVYGEGNPTAEAILTFDGWALTKTVYAAGAVVALSIFAVRLFTLLKIIRRTPRYSIDKFTILESPRHEYTSFSFFNFIFIGKSATLTDEEKALIIEHERIHAKRLHSLDVMLAHTIGIVFWFNPLIRIYKKIFIHLHEYEADARAVKYRDVNEYCSLLAKVALLSADIRLASHFSSSLTLKRIQMMRKIKSKIKWWKFAVVGAAVPLFFVAVSCQDQLVKEAKQTASDSSVAFDVPQVIVDRLESVKKSNPNSTYFLVEFNEEGDRLLEKLEKVHGYPVSMELFTPDNFQHKHEKLNTEPDKITFNTSREWEVASQSTGLRTFAIIEYNDKVYTEVDEMATPLNGIPEFYQHVASKIVYPKEARMKGIEGKVFVEFIVQTDGSLNNIHAIKGIGAGCDEVAVMVVKSYMAKWKPGTVNGVAVKQSVVLPITFKLGTTSELKGSEKVVRGGYANGTIDELVVVGKSQE